MTKREVVSRLRMDLVEHFADSVLYNRHLWSAFWSAAKVLIQREADYNKLKDQRVFKRYNLDTEEVNLYEGSCVPLECISCRVRIPKTLMSKHGVVYSFLGSQDMHTKYHIVSPGEFVVKSKIKGINTRFAFPDGDYLYLSKCIPCVLFLVVPEASDETPPAGKCSIMDTDSGVPGYLEEGAIAIAKESLTFTLRKQYDLVANKDPKS